MRKNFIKKSISITLAMVSILGVAGCGPKGPGVINDGKTINVRLFKGGYGTEWVYTLAEQFEQAYQAEGYKVNILTPSSDMRGNTVLLELAQGVSETSVDLYITGNVPSETVGANGEYGVLVEDVKESVFNKKAISYDGTEEEKTVAEKLSVEFLPYTKDSTGATYMVPYINTAAGFVVNTKKLDKYGLELPKTTNELLDCFQKIYLGHNGVAHSESTKVFPITYVPGTNNGYSNCWLYTMLAQYDLEEFYEFMSMETVDAEGNSLPMSNDGYKVFDYQGIEEMLAVAYAGFDINIAAYGTTTQTLDQAQAQIMKTGGAVFMCNGDWMLNEVKLNYANYLNDIEFMNFPVLSAVGTKLFGNGTSYNFSDAKCEELLSYIIGLVDEKKTVDEIVAMVESTKDVTLAKEDVKAVATARGVYYNRGKELQAYITKNSPNKEIAALFLRMMASDDCTKTIAEYANASSAYATEENTLTSYEFTKQASRVTTNPYATMIDNENKGFRKSLKISSLFTSVTHLPSHIASQKYSIYDGKGKLVAGKTLESYREKAIGLKTDEYNYAMSKWNTWISK